MKILALDLGNYKSVVDPVATASGSVLLDPRCWVASGPIVIVIPLRKRAVRDRRCRR
jgi:hypothetical protein